MVQPTRRLSAAAVMPARPAIKTGLSLGSRQLGQFLATTADKFGKHAQAQGAALLGLEIDCQRGRVHQFPVEEHRHQASTRQLDLLGGLRHAHHAAIAQGELAQVVAMLRIQPALHDDLLDEFALVAGRACIPIAPQVQQLAVGVAIAQAVVVDQLTWVTRNAVALPVGGRGYRELRHHRQVAPHPVTGLEPADQTPGGRSLGRPLRQGAGSVADRAPGLDNWHERPAMPARWRSAGKKAYRRLPACPAAAAAPAAADRRQPAIAPATARRLRHIARRPR